MNSIQITGAILAIAFVIVSCQRVETGEPVSMETKNISGIRKYTDPDTGCQYITLYGEAITPRLQNGQPMCGSS